MSTLLSFAASKVTNLQQHQPLSRLCTKIRVRSGILLHLDERKSNLSARVMAQHITSVPEAWSESGFDNFTLRESEIQECENEITTKHLYGSSGECVQAGLRTANECGFRVCSIE